MRIHTTQASYLTPISISGGNNDTADVVTQALQKLNYLPLTITSRIFSESLPPPTGTLLNQIHPYYQVYAMSNIVSTWKAIATGVTHQDTKYQEKYWKAWQCYAATWNIYPSFKTGNNSTSSLLSHIFLHRFVRVTMARAFKSRFQLLIRRYRPSPRLCTWLENLVPSKLRITTKSSPSNS